MKCPYHESLQYSLPLESGNCINVRRYCFMCLVQGDSIHVQRSFFRSILIYIYFQNNLLNYVFEQVPTSQMVLDLLKY